MKISPRYVSQWGDLACNHAVIERKEDPSAFRDWRADGYSTVEEYRRWSRNTCGIACLESILSTRAGHEQSKWELITGAVAVGALVPRDGGRIDGLYYQPFVEWVGTEFGIEAEVRRVLLVDEIGPLVRAGEWFVIASVSSEIRWPQRPPSRQGGHLVLVHDAEDDELIFHNPSGLGSTAANARCDTATFARFFAGRGIVVRRT